jgi:hypothetical protein
VTGIPRLAYVYDDFLGAGRVQQYMTKRISSNFVTVHHRLSAGNPVKRKGRSDYRTEYSWLADDAISQQ